MNGHGCFRASRMGSVEMGFRISWSGYGCGDEMFTRAMELGISIPDPMVLSGALQKATDGLSMKSPQVAYRLNMVRQQLGVDVKPTFQAIWGFSEHVQAEAEELMIGLGGDGGSGGSSSKGGTS